MRNGWDSASRRKSAPPSPDEERLGFGFPKEERAALVASEPGKFMMPLRSDERYNWVRARLPVLDEDELRELIIDAWCMVVPKKIAASYLDSQAAGRSAATAGRPRLRDEAVRWAGATRN